MDDLKLYARIHERLTQLTKLVDQFSNDVKMNFVLDKCKDINLNKGKYEFT